MQRKIVKLCCKAVVFVPWFIGNKCGGSRSIGYRCIADCEELAKEIKKMPYDFDHITSGYRTHYRSLNFETMEVKKMQQKLKHRHPFY